MNHTETIRQVVERFLAAFRDLEWTPFLAAFAEEATVFFPFPDQPRRADGKGAIAATFQPFFVRIREEHPEGPPYLMLDPDEVAIHLTGNMALVTFHLTDPGVLCRRTLVLEQQDDQWLILHLHASNVPFST